MSPPRRLFAIRNIEAARVNLMMNDFAAGLPSPLSFLGLADLLARRMGLAPWSARVLPVLHRVHVSDGRTKAEMTRNERKKAGDPESFVPVEIMEDLTGKVEVSLLIEIPGCDDELDLRRSLTGCRIAGGLIQNDVIDVIPVTADGSAFRELRRGYAMVRPDDPQRQRISTGDPEGLRAIAATLFPAERPQGFGWIIPAAVGYRLLEDPDSAPKRIRTRSRDVPHVFAEPAVGIAELISVRNPRLTALAEDTLAALLWSWDARDRLVLGHIDYHPATEAAS